MRRWPPCVLAACAWLAACGDEAEPIPEPTATPGPKQPPGHERMLARLREIAERTPDEHYYQGDGRARKLRAQLERLGSKAPWRIYLDAGRAELELGNERRGIELLSTAYRGLRDGSLGGGRTARTEVAFHLGVGYLRLAETENCCAIPNADSCILPLRGGGVHSATEGAKEAFRYFREVVGATSADEDWHLASRWLLNLAAMALGDYPDGVPERFRIPTATFESEVEFPRFVNIARGLGVDTFSLSGSVIADDFDGDSDLDLVVSTWDTHGQLRLFRNEGDGTFADRTEAAGLTGLFGGLNLVQADYDNDGDVDFLVLRGAWLFEHGHHPNSLVRNNGDGTFTDVTFDAGLGRVHYPTQTAAWADFDLDGDLDLYVGNESSRQAPSPCQLFENRGDGTFVDIAASAGVENERFTKAVAWGDYDGDRDPDLYVSNNGQPNRLYENRGDGTFVDVAEEKGVAEPTTSFPAWFWDYDNDGALDLFVSCYGTWIGDIAAHALGRPRDHELPRLYRGDGAGGFVDVAEAAGVTYPAMPMGSNFADLDNDGWLDFYLGTGNVYYFSLMPNLMFLNQNGERFVDVTMAGGFGHLQKGHGIAFADLDHDGDLDVFEQVGGAFKGDAFRDALWENPGFGNAWIAVELVGTSSNRSAIGARIRVSVVDDGGTERSLYRWVGSGGSFGCNPLRQTIGLGAAGSVRAIEVFWPKSGITQRFEEPPIGQLVRIIEGEDELDVRALEPFALRRD